MRTQICSTLGLALTVTAGALAQDLVRPSSAMLRHPDVSKSHIVFAYANDLWLVPREGGVAVPVASPDGPEDFPRFSPDGANIAFVGNYEGDRDLYTVPTAGGPAVRVTYHPGDETLNDWTAGGKLLFYSADHAGYRRLEQLFTVDPTGGAYDQIPVPYGAKGSISEDGKWLAYTPYTRDNRTWKRYRGGWASDVWLFNLETYESRQITDWEGTDTQPCFFGTKVYYLSDMGDEHRWNVWSYDVRTQAREQLTTFKDFDVKSHAVGPGPNGKGEIVLQSGAGLYLLNPSNKDLKKVDVRVPGDRRTLRAERVDFSDNITAASLSPSGNRLAVTARGDVWDVPANEGVTYHLARNNGAAERNALWSPDGMTIAYLSDESGEYEIHLVPADRKGEARQLTHLGEKFKFLSGWSYDSKKILFTDNTGRLAYADAETGDVTDVTKDEWGNPPVAGWSHDSAWIGYLTNGENNMQSLWLYEVATGEATRVTDPIFNISNFTFDQKGEWLYFTTNRHFSPTFNQVPNDMSFTYTDTEVICAVPLRNDIKSPMLPSSDEEPALTKKDEDDDKGDKDAEKSDDDPKDESADSEKSDEDAADEDAEEDEKDEEPEAMTIDLEGFEARAILLPVGNANYGGLLVNDKGALLYSQGSDIKIYDMFADDPEVEDVISGAFMNGATPDGKKLLVRQRGNFAVINTAKGQKADDTVPMGSMHAQVNPREEWTQIFNDAWRVFRDYFYDANMHGVDWQAVHDMYEPLLADCVVRDDLTFVIQEMISELNVGHAYYRPQSAERGPRESSGLLGADYELTDEDGSLAYRIKTIVNGADWDVDARSPLAVPGVDVNEGDYLLAVNGIPVDTSKDPWAPFVGLGNRTVMLTVSDKPVIDDDARDVLVNTVTSESTMRFRRWIEDNRRYIDENSDGKIGYVYIMDVTTLGLNDTYRQYFGQLNKEALIIDDRWNGGGFVFVPERLVEMFSRTNTNFWARRDGRNWNNPGGTHIGPKALLINGLSASGGDMFPYLWRQAGIGPLIGTRTWGGLVGLNFNPAFIDGTSARVPTFGFFENDGTWGIEGHGVDPDIEVIDDPARMVNGSDPQLDAAITYLLAELKRNPPVKMIPSPPGPDRSGMGIAEEDK